MTYLRQGLHDTPALLTAAVQKEIDLIDSGDDLHTYKNEYSKREFDAILLGYGLCSNGTMGLSSGKISNYYSARARLHHAVFGIAGKNIWNILMHTAAHTGIMHPGSKMRSPLPKVQTMICKNIMQKKFGEENADFLVEAELTSNYNRCAYVKWDELPFAEYEKYTREAAEHLGWDFDLVCGDSGYLRDFFMRELG